MLIQILKLQDHDLSDPENGSVFKADKKLKKLLGAPVHLLKKKNPELGKGYGYANLQTYLAPHFHKDSPSE
jgi:chromatin remodeling complex protein RSC6